jgi:peptide/nickel transport system substrate-binding protein
VGSRRLAVIVALGVASTLALNAASASSTGARGGGTLRIVIPSVARPTLDPALEAAPLNWGGLWYATCATLVAFRDAPAPEGYTPRPEAAVGFPTVSRNGRTYVFTVRRGLHFSDGSSLTAANFAYAIRRMLNPALRADAAALFADVKRVSASGRRLRIELRKRSGDLLTRLALGYACPVPLGFPVDPAGVALLAGSGPYHVGRYETGRLVVLERNRYYRGSRPARVDRITITIGGDFGANIRAVEQGQADLEGAAVPFELQDTLVQRYGINTSQFFRIRGTVIHFLALNASRPLFRGNVALRKAVNLALNRTEIVKAGPGWPLSHPLTDQIDPRWVPRWADYRVYPLAEPNLKRARRLAAGNLRGGKAVLYADQTPFLLDQANIIARQLVQIGLQVTVTPLAPAVLNARAGTAGAPYDMVLTRYFLHYPDPADVLIRLLAGENARRPAGNTNFAYFDSPRYDRRMAAADRLTGSARLQALSKLDAEIMRDAAPWAPLYEGSNWLFISKHVGCFKLHPVFRLDLAAMCLR